MHLSWARSTYAAGPPEPSGSCERSARGGAKGLPRWFVPMVSALTSRHAAMTTSRRSNRSMAHVLLRTINSGSSSTDSGSSPASTCISKPTARLPISCIGERIVVSGNAPAAASGVSL